MPTKSRTPKTSPKAWAETPALQAEAKAKLDEQTARILTDGTLNAFVVQKYHGGKNVCNFQAIKQRGDRDAEAVGRGDLSSLEHMLLTQATALQAMFADLALRAKQQNRFDGIQTLTSLALKCAAQSRQAIVALAELRLPKSVMFAKQANVTSGPQQVNNSVSMLTPTTNGAGSVLSEGESHLLPLSDGPAMLQDPFAADLTISSLGR